MARIHDTLYLTIGSDKQGGMVMTVHKVVAGGHIAVNELRGNDAMHAYNFITKQKNAGIPVSLRGAVNNGTVR